MPTPIRPHILTQPDELEDRIVAPNPVHVVHHDLAILEHENDGYDPYDSAPGLSDNQLEANFGKRKPGLRK